MAATASKKKVSTSSDSHIHDDIAFSILSKLPIKSLKRFTCAKKSWSLLFQNPNFMNMFRTNFLISKHDDDAEMRLLIKEQFPVHQSLFIVSGERFEIRANLEWPLPLQQQGDNANQFPFPFQMGGGNEINVNDFAFHDGDVGDENANLFPFQMGGGNNVNANLFPFQVGDNNANMFPFQVGGDNGNANLFPFQVGDNNANANFFPFQEGDNNANPFHFQAGDNNVINVNDFAFQVGDVGNANANANPFPFTPSIFILGSASVNGTLCLYQGLTIVLWNPSTSEFKIIPPSFQPKENIEFNLPPHGFGYDCVTNDFKVIRKVRYPMEFEGRLYQPFWEIYSLRSDSWRKLDRFDDMPDYYPGITSLVNLNGFCHWLTQGPDIISFDFRKETFIATTLPSSDVLHISYTFALVELNESLSVIYNYNRTPDFHIWVLGEVGVNESWTMLFVVGPYNCSIVCPISVGNKNRIFFREEDSELGWLDLSTQRVERFEVQGESFCTHMVIYKENLLPFPRNE